MSDWFEECLAKYKRIAITGGPRTGKTTLSLHVQDRPVIHTDDFMDEPWACVPRMVIEKCGKVGDSFVVEGVQVPRAMRKGMLVDAVIWLDSPLVKLNNGQRTMRDGVLTVMDEVRQTMRAAWIFAPVGVLKRAIRSA